MKRQALAALFSLVALGPALLGTAQAGRPVGEVVSPRLLGRTLKYAEFLIESPAMRERTDALGVQRNTYRLGKCIVELGINDLTVVAVGTYVGYEGCDLNVSEWVQRKGAKASKTRLKDYAHWGPLHFTDAQLPSCNACGEGGVSALIDGTSVMGNYEIQLVADGEAQARSEWRDLLAKAGVDGDSLPLTGMGCPLRQFDAQAFNLMKDYLVSSIAFGKRGALQPACSGKAVHSLILRGQ